MANINHLFVYGTLRQGVDHPMQDTLRRYATYIGTGTLRGKLYDLGPYPGAVASSKTCDRVTGEIYKLQRDSRVLAILDTYEGRLFRREALPVWQQEGNQLIAWVYLYRGSVRERKRIATGNYVSSLRAR